jgi:hypothetical protein
MSSSIGVRLPGKSDPRWAALVTGGTGQPVKLLALKFMLARMAQDAKRDASPAAIRKASDELYRFFEQNEKLVATDTATLFG